MTIKLLHISVKRKDFWTIPGLVSSAKDIVRCANDGAEFRN